MQKLKNILILFAAVAIIFTVTDVFARRGGSFGFRGGFGRRTFSSRSYHSTGGGFRGHGFGFFPVFMPFGFGGGFFSLLILAGIIYAIVSIMRKRNRGNGGYYGEQERAVVARLSMAFMATEKDLQTALAELARRQPPGTPEQAQAYLLRETALLLLRHLDAVTKLAFEQHKGLDMTRAQSLFEELAMRMRSAFDQAGIRRDEAGLHTNDTPDTEQASGVAQYVVVSIIVAYTEPASILEPISSVNDLRVALQNVASIGPDRLMGMEVIWDPESPDGVLDQEGMDRSYPDLISV